MKKLETKACATCGGRGTMPADGVGALLRTERERLGIKAKDMYEALSVSSTYLFDLERDSRTWTNELLESYQKALKELGDG